MRIAIMPRFIDLAIPDGPANKKLYVNQHFELLARKMGVGLFPVISPFDIDDICSICDGLIIPGSNTGVNPAYYGGKPMEKKQDYDEYGFAVKVMDQFVGHNKPIFGICAGHQAINIYFGGTLGYVTSDNTRPHSKTRHFVNIKRDSFLYDAFKDEKANINSYHIKCIDKLAPGLEVVARADDGIIEAVQHKEKKIFGTQWHPEMTFTENKAEEKLFENFIECCKR